MISMTAPWPLGAPTSVLLDRFGLPCESSREDDGTVAKCDDWCGEDLADRCEFCRCRACARCAALPQDGSATLLSTEQAAEAALMRRVASTIVSAPEATDCSGLGERSCEEFCSPIKGQHCTSCRCALCPWCLAFHEHELRSGPPTTMIRLEKCDWVQGMKIRQPEKDEFCSSVTEYGRAQCELHITRWRLGVLSSSEGLHSWQAFT